MTREQVITRVKHSSMYIGDRETADYIINVLEQQSYDCVSLGVYKQVMRERDIAIEQLRELGYEFGEKIRTSDDCVSREQVVKTVLDWYFNLLEGNETKDIVNLLDVLPSVIPTFPKGVTNGDVVKTMFPDADVKEMLGSRSQDYLWNWWGEPYKRGDSNDRN